MKICLLLLIAAGMIFSAGAAKSSHETSSNETSTQSVIRTLVWPDGTRYVGMVFDGKRDGKGTITWQDGTQFVGHFKDDLKNGPGTLILISLISEKLLGIYGISKFVDSIFNLDFFIVYIYLILSTLASILWWGFIILEKFTSKK